MEDAVGEFYGSGYEVAYITSINILLSSIRTYLTAEAAWKCSSPVCLERRGQHRFWWLSASSVTEGSRITPNFLTRTPSGLWLGSYLGLSYLLVTLAMITSSFFSHHFFFIGSFLVIVTMYRSYRSFSFYFSQISLSLYPALLLHNTYYHMQDYNFLVYCPH